jgi:hypothetical protein
MRVEQAAGERGSLKWIQRAVAEHSEELEAPVLARLPAGAEIEWRSPVAADGYAEYRDAAFLNLLGLDALTPALREFWPAKGPQWDALGVTSTGQVLLVEAKSHIREFCTPPSAAGPDSLSKITFSLDRAAAALGSSRGALWPSLFYQFTNRLAHLWWLRQAGVEAYLVLVGFVGDQDMNGPATAEAWDAAYSVAEYVLDLNARHPLARYVVHAHPSVQVFSND